MSWLAAAAIAVLTPTSTLAKDNIFTIANYPVDARADDAVAAKNKAVAAGQKAALRSLMKRLMPASAYGHLKKLGTVNAATFVDGTSVRSERNSSTEYIANLDFIFQPASIRQWLDREGIPFTDEAAAQSILVPIWRAPASGGDTPSTFGPTEGPKTWTDAWKGLDLANSLTPLKLETLKPDVLPDTLKALASGDAAFVRTFAGAYNSPDRLVAAIAEPDMATGRLTVTLIGNDGVGPLAWKHSYRLDKADPTYAVELAAVVSLGVLEGRWKSIKVQGAATAAYNPPHAPANAAFTPGDREPIAATANGDGNLQLNVEFRGMGEWQDLSRRISAVPGVEYLDVLGMSGRGARITLKFPGGIDRLQAALATQNLALRNDGQRWTIVGN